MAQENPLFAFTEDERAYLAGGWSAREELLSPYAARFEDAVYERPDEVDPDVALIRPSFVRDVDRILNNAFYNRCMDKTQVFPFFKNDDLTRRSFHLQLVSQTARKLGGALRLNTALIEAIAIGHDMGHTPFGHAGERALNDLYRAHTGRCFNHNVQSVRLLRTVARRNLSLQSLNGMLAHCGEKAFARYEPAPCATFADLDALMERCYTQPGASQQLRPGTLEGCVVRICDILAYLGKDRQDALSAHVIAPEEYQKQDSVIGHSNRDFIRNVTANIVKNSIEQPYLAMDEEVFSALLAAKDWNSRVIYHSPAAHEKLDAIIAPMMGRIYERCLDDLARGDESAWIFRHHLNAWMMQGNAAYASEEPNAIVCDYIASMTDEYFIDLYNYLYPEDAKREGDLYVPYFR